MQAIERQLRRLSTAEALETTHYVSRVRGGSKWTESGVELMVFFFFECGGYFQVLGHLAADQAGREKITQENYHQQADGALLQLSRQFRHKLVGFESNDGQIRVKKIEHPQT